MFTNIRMPSTFLRRPLHHLAGLRLVVVREAQPLQVVVDVVADVVRDTLRDPLACVRLPELEDAARGRGGGDEDGRDDQRVDVAVRRHMTIDGARVDAGVDGVRDQRRADELERREAGERADRQRQPLPVRHGVAEQPDWDWHATVHHGVGRS
jgi:hypothetical protein